MAGNTRTANQELLRVYYFTSPIHREIDRKYGKFDDELSYVGGLFGIVMSFFGFFMLSMNEYRYELAVAEGAFSSEFEEKKKISEFHMGFLTYVKYSIYDWIKALFDH